MKAIKILSISILAIVLFSCSKDDDNAPAPEREHLNLLKKTTDSDDGLTRIYTYDNSNRCTGYTSGVDVASTTQYAFHYDSNGRVTELTEDPAGVSTNTKYFYNAEGKLTRKEGRGGIDIFLYTYESSQVVEDYTFTVTNEGWRQIWSFDAKGNPIELKSYQNITTANPSGTYAGRIRYTYDDKKFSASALPWVLNFPDCPVNNQLTTQFNEAAAGPALGYEYNTDGYPTKMIGNYTRVYEYQRL